MTGAPGSGPGTRAISPLSDEEVRLLRTAVREESGIHLGESRRALLAGRLSRRLRSLGLVSFGAYYRLISRDEAERARMIDCISTNETRFFREPRHFEFLETRVIPEWIAHASARRRAKRVRVWSAGCATGEEPFSLAMALLDRLPPGSGWSADVLATDVSNRALELARASLWPVAKAEHIPVRYLEQFMLRGTGSRAGQMKAGAEIRSLVRFQRLNLHRDPYPEAAPFDLIFCRNVLMYFDVPAKVAVVERLASRLAPRGYLLLGHAESATGLGELHCVEPTIYSPAASPGRCRPPRPAAGAERCGFA